MREKRLRFCGFELAIAVEPNQAERIRRNPAYRYLLRPVMGLLEGFRHNGRGRREADSNLQPPVVPPTMEQPLSEEAAAVLNRISETEWYHVIDLPHGISTPGRVDHRSQVGLYGLPDDMRGMRALDVATFDGFWAFEMERRGAEVLAVDIGKWSQADIPLRWLEKMTPEEDAPTGAGFRIAKELLYSNVDRRETSVYDLTPDEVGTFDLVFMSDLLLHLRDPQRALEKLYSVTRENGCVIVAEPYSPDLERFENVALTQFVAYTKYVWSVPSTVTLKRMLEVAGFTPVEASRFRLNFEHPFSVEKVVLKGYPRRDR